MNRILRLPDAIGKPGNGTRPPPSVLEGWIADIQTALRIMLSRGKDRSLRSLPAESAPEPWRQLLLEAVRYLDGGGDPMSEADLIAALSPDAFSAYAVLEERWQGIEEQPEEPALALRTLGEVLDQPRPEPLCEGTFAKGSLVLLYGSPGAGKTMIGVDLAGCFVTGVEWFEHTVTRGPIVWVAAEGAADIGDRFRAWGLRGGRILAEDCSLRRQVLILDQAVNLADPTATGSFLTLIEHATPQPPVAVFFDTMSECMPGQDENSSAATSLVTRSCRAISRATGAACFLLHHARKDGKGYRGSSAIHGAVDTMALVEAVSDTIRMTCEKQRASRLFPTVTYQLEEAEEPGLARVRQVAQNADRITTESVENRWERFAVDSLRFADFREGATRSQLLAASGIPVGSFARVISRLIDKGYVRKKGTNRGTRYFLVEDNRHWQE